VKKIREPFNTYSHIFGAILSVIGVEVLFFKDLRNAINPLDNLIYGLSLTFMFVSSSLYHSLDITSKMLPSFRKLDHCSIYILIAATYTPVIVKAADKEYRIMLLALMWSIAITGILIKIFFPYPSRWLYTGFYLGMGWVGILFLPRIHLSKVSLDYALSGGIVYTMGAFSYILKWPQSRNFNFHNLWHLMVLLGSFFMYLMVYSLVPS
jgi:hemolysin III